MITTATDTYPYHVQMDILIVHVLVLVNNSAITTVRVDISIVHVHVLVDILIVHALVNILIGGYDGTTVSSTLHCVSNPCN